MKVEVKAGLDVARELKSITYTEMRSDGDGNIWFLGVRKVGKDVRAIALRHDGTKATSFLLPDDTGHIYPRKSFASSGAVVYLGTRTGVLRIEGDAVEDLGSAKKDAKEPYVLGAGGEHVFATFTSGETSPRTNIHRLEKGKWRALKTPKVDSLRSLTVVGGGLVAMENSLEESWVLKLDGTKAGKFKTYRSTMNITAGEKRFVTLTDTVAELRDTSGKQTRALTTAELAKRIKGETPVFECAAHIGSDTFLLFVHDHRDAKKPGHLVRWADAKITVDESKLPSDFAASEIAVDRTGTIWLCTTSWKGKSTIVRVDEGEATTIKK